MEVIMQREEPRQLNGSVQIATRTWVESQELQTATRATEQTRIRDGRGNR